MFEQVLPEDLIEYGLIPEFIGRLPVVAAIHQLTRDDLITILTEPRNALTQQFQRFFEFDDIELQFQEDSLSAIADKALERETGARGLRSILEETLMDVQFELPSRRDVSKCVVTRETIEQGLRADAGHPGGPRRARRARRAGRGRVRLSLARRLLIAVCVGLASPAPGADAAELRVSTGADTPPGSCAPGSCTLREAILAANADPGEDVIVLRPSTTYRLGLAGAGEDAGATGDLDVTEPVQIVATGHGRAEIDGAAVDRVLDLHAATKLEGLEVTGGLAQGNDGAQAAGVRVTAGRLTLRDCAIVANAGPESALELLGDDGMTARDSTVLGNVGDGIVDRGGGGVRAAHTEIRANTGNGLKGFGPGSLSLYHGVISDNGLDGVQELDDGDVAVVDAIVSGNDGEAIDERGPGGLYVRRSRLRANGAGTSEDGDGELSVYRSRLTGSRGEAAVERGPGGIAFIKARVAFNDGVGLSEFDDGSIGLEETTLEGSPDGGAVERGEGGIVLTLARVIDNGGVGLEESGGGDLALIRSQVSGSGAAAITLDGSASLLRSRLIDNGGGIVVDGGSVSLGRSTVAANSGLGGIAATDASVSLRQSTVGRNFSTTDGGGVAIAGAGSLRASNSTIAENFALGSGGGVFLGAGAAASLNAVTVASNRAEAGPGGGIALDPAASASVENSLLAGNRSGPERSDCFGSALVSGGGNVIGTGAGCDGAAGGGDLVRPRPRIAALAPNGGPTPTVALLAGSPAIGAAGRDAPRRDQRNVDRRDPDAGAYELRRG